MKINKKQTIIIFAITSILLGVGVALTACKSKKKKSSPEEEIDNTNYISAPQTAVLKTPAQLPSFLPNPTFTVEGVEAGDTVYLYKNARCTEQGLLGSSVVPAEQTEVDITINALPTAGRYPIYAKRVNAQGDPSRCSAKLAAYNLIGCPDESFVPVEGNAELGVDPFCVMRTEVKAIKDGVPRAQDAGRPIDFVSAPAAKQACLDLQVPYGSCNLLSNRQWMAIARDIEATAANWSGGEVGSGTLNRGHSDSSPGRTLSIADPDDPWDQTGQTMDDWTQKRTHVLSNGSVLWDFAGNGREWVDWDPSTNTFSVGPNTCPEAYTSPLTYSCAELNPLDYLPGNPAGKASNEYTAALTAVGKISGTSAERLAAGGGGAAARGGHYAHGQSSGIFALVLDLDPQDAKNSIGFRCGCVVEGPNFDETFLAPPYAITLKAPHASPSFSTAATFTVQGGNPGDTIHLYHSATCSELAALGSAVVASGKDAVDIATNLPGLGDYYLYATRTNPAGQTSACSHLLGHHRVITCPNEYYARVPGNPLLGTADFCVMRMEARHDESNIPLADFEHTPWGSANGLVKARNYCRSIPLRGGGCALILNRQWMTIALDIEANPANWSGGAVGSGQLNRGHSDNSPNQILSIVDPTDPWDQTDPEGVATPWSQKRTHVLRNGEVLWDLAGNLQEWVEWDEDSADFSIGPNTCEVTFTDPFSVNCPELNPLDYLPANPAGIAQDEYTNANYGLGLIKGTSEDNRNNGGGGAAMRGGEHTWGSKAGIFALNLDRDANSMQYRDGFRCVCDTTDPNEEL